MSGKRIAQFVPEVPPVLHEVEQRPWMPVIGLLLSRNLAAARGASRVGGPAVVLDRRFEPGELLPEFGVTEIFDLGRGLRSAERIKGIDCQAIGLFDRVIHEVAANGLAGICSIRAKQ